MLALSVLARPWPVWIWISKAFVNLMRRLTGQGSADGSIVNVSSSIAGNCTSSDLDETCPKDLSSHAFNGDSPDRCEPSTQANLHPDYFTQPAAADQLIYDSFSAGYGCLDNIFDVDLLLHNSMAFQGLNGVGELETSNF